MAIWLNKTKKIWLLVLGGLFLLSLFLPFKMVLAKDKVAYFDDHQKLLAVSSPTPKNTAGSKTPATTNSGGFKTPEGGAGATGGESAPPVSSSIRNALSPDNPGTDWVITSWKVVLGLANLALVAILVFLAAVNILNIQYDTYAIKKVLPILIIGVLLADFSLLIIRMLLDFSNILTMLFTNPENLPQGQTPAQFAGSLIKGAKEAMAPGGQQWGAAQGLGVLFIWFLFSLLVMVAFFILGFMFYIRYIVIIVCAIAAPLAFIAMAFPPTQGFFKQWWGWLTKFIFMKPIAFFFLWVAYEVKKSGAMGSITGWMIMAFLIIAAVIIPFKLGGSIMGAWGKAGQWLTGTKAGGYIRKPIDNYIQSKKDAWKARANLAAEKYLGMAGRRQRHEFTMADIQGERDKLKAQAEDRLRTGRGKKQAAKEISRQLAKQDLESTKAEQATKVWKEDKKRAEEIADSYLRSRTAKSELDASQSEEINDRFIKGVDRATGQTWARRLGELESRATNAKASMENLGKYANLEIASELDDRYYNTPSWLRYHLKEMDMQRRSLIMIDQKKEPEAYAAAEKKLQGQEQMAYQELEKMQGVGYQEDIVAEEDIHDPRTGELIHNKGDVLHRKGEKVLKADDVKRFKRAIEDPTFMMVEAHIRSISKGVVRDHLQQTARAEARTNTPAIKRADKYNGNNHGPDYYEGITHRPKVPQLDAQGNPVLDENGRPVMVNGEEDGGDVAAYYNGEAARDHRQLRAFRPLHIEVLTDQEYLADARKRAQGVSELCGTFADVSEHLNGRVFNPATGKDEVVTGLEAAAHGVGAKAVMDRIASTAFQSIPDSGPGRGRQLLLQRMEEQLSRKPDVIKAVKAQRGREMEIKRGQPAGTMSQAEIEAIDIYAKDENGDYHITAEMMANTHIDPNTERLAPILDTFVQEAQRAQSPGDEGEVYRAMMGVDTNGAQRQVRIAGYGDPPRDLGKMGSDGQFPVDHPVEHYAMTRAEKVADDYWFTHPEGAAEYFAANTEYAKGYAQRHTKQPIPVRIARVTPAPAAAEEAPPGGGASPDAAAAAAVEERLHVETEVEADEAAETAEEPER